MMPVQRSILLITGQIAREIAYLCLSLRYHFFLAEILFLRELFMYVVMGLLDHPEPRLPSVFSRTLYWALLYIIFTGDLAFLLTSYVMQAQLHSFIHSGYFISVSSSPILLRGAPDTERILCRSFTPKRHRQLRVKDLPTVPTWRLERDSIPATLRTKGAKSTNGPLRPRLCG